MGARRRGDDARDREAAHPRHFVNAFDAGEFVGGIQAAMTSTNGMFAIVYGPATPPDGTSPEDYEAAEAVRRE